MLQLNESFNRFCKNVRIVINILLDNNATLEIRTAKFTTDTGAYKCTAKNTAGRSHDIGTIFIENERVPKYSQSKDINIFKLSCQFYVNNILLCVIERF